MAYFRGIFPLGLKGRFYAILDVPKILVGPAIYEGSFKSTKAMYHLTCLVMENCKIFVLFLYPNL